MINNDEEYHHSRAKLELSRKAQRLRMDQLVIDGLTPDQIKRMLDPVDGFLDQIQFEIDGYDGLR